MRLLFFQVADIPRFARDRLVARRSRCVFGDRGAGAGAGLQLPDRRHPVFRGVRAASPADVRPPAQQRRRADRHHLSHHVRRLPGSGYGAVGQPAADHGLFLGARDLRRRPDRQGGGDAADQLAGAAARIRPAPAAGRSPRWPAVRARPRRSSFVTGDGPIGQPPTETPPFASVQAILDAKCGGGCHLGADDGGTGAWRRRRRGCRCARPTPGTRLVGVPSRQADRLRLVEPGDSSRSYLLRKLLPASPDGGPIAGVSGQREPPGEPLPEDQLRLIAAWIDGGALR